MPDAKLSITELYFYPVKSCAGIKLERAEIGTRGFLNDRRWMVIGDDDRFITQRECDLMAHVKPSVSQSGILSLTAPGMPEITVTPDNREQLRLFEVRVWSAVCQAQEESNEAAQWLSEFLKRPSKLVRMADGFERYAIAPGDQSKKGLESFVDAYPFLIISAESLQDLNSRFDLSLPINRFRPNIVVTGTSPYAEDSWRRIKIGDVTFTGAESCGRCVITTIDQASLEHGREPLRALSTFRKLGDQVMFGQYFIHENEGTVEAGDQLSVLA